MSDFDPSTLGPPALKIQGFQLWIHSRQFPESRDFWDANWLYITAHCGASEASVWAQGAILMTADIERFLEQCIQLHERKSDTASLKPLEPSLEIELAKWDRRGNIRMRVQITPDQMTQKHEMSFELDQSYLPEIVRQCRIILEEFPVVQKS